MPETTAKKVHNIIVRLPEPAYYKLRQIARNDGCTMTSVLRSAVNNVLGERMARIQARSARL